MKLLKIKAQGIEPSVRIGKGGITASVVDEIKNQLAKKKIVKIKCLKSFIQTRDRRLLAAELAEKTNSKAVYQVGFVIVLART
jgi:RNA-binding protein YhbY